MAPKLRNQHVDVGFVPSDSHNSDSVTGTEVSSGPIVKSSSSSVGDNNHTKMTTSSSSSSKTTVAAAVKDAGTSSIVQKVSSVVAVGLSIVLAISYFGYHEEVFMNHFNFVTRFMWLVALIISATFQDTIQPKNKVPTSIEYHTQTVILSGYTAYGLAGYILASSSTFMKTTTTTTIPASTTTAIWDNIVAFLKSHSDVVASFVERYEDKSALFFALAILASYHGFQNLFGSVWIEATKPKRLIQRSTLETLEYNLAVPLCLLGMLLFQQDPTSSTPAAATMHSATPQDDPLGLMSLISLLSSSHLYYDYATSIMYGWIVLKMIRLALAFRQNAKVNTVHFPYPESYPPYLLKNKPQQQVDGIKNDAVAFEEYNYEATTTKTDGPKYTWRIYGNAYDMTSFVHNHPGGVEPIMLGANRDDCTPLFQSYHPFNIKKAKQLLQKYRIKDNKNNKEEGNKKKTTEQATKKDDDVPLGNSHHNDLFYDVLCERVASKLRDGYNIDPIKDRGAPFVRVVSYAFLITITVMAAIAHFKGYILGSICLGSFGVCLGGHLGHDGGHFAVSRIPLINDICVWGISIICNPIIWQHQHTFGHHSFTNNKEQDPDLHHFRGLMKLWDGEDAENRAPMVKNQSSFAYIMYIFAHSTFSENHLFPVMFTLDRSLHGIVEWTDRKRWLRTFGFFLHFTLYMSIMLGPFFICTTLHAVGNLVGFLFASGLQFSLCSQVGHITEWTLDDEQIARNKEKRHEIAKNSWAADQIERSNDFCSQDNFWFGVAGGLNLQIEHHLFPGLNHWHLTKIQPLVEETCKEYGVDYKGYDTFRELFWETIRYFQKHARTGNE